MYGLCSMKRVRKKIVPIDDENDDKGFWDWVELFRARKKKITPDNVVEKNFWDWTEDSGSERDFYVKVFYLKRWNSRGLTFDIRSYIIKNYYV
jgi:hypothetical protein